MDYLEIIDKKINQYEADLKLITVSLKSIDKIKTATVKIKFEDLIVEEIKRLGNLINELKTFLKEEKAKRKNE